MPYPKLTRPVRSYSVHLGHLGRCQSPIQDVLEVKPSKGEEVNSVPARDYACRLAMCWQALGPRLPSTSTIYERLSSPELFSRRLFRLPFRQFDLDIESHHDACKEKYRSLQGRDDVRIFILLEGLIVGCIGAIVVCPLAGLL